MILVLGFLLTLCSILIVCWQGWNVTEKYFSRPQTTSTVYRRLETVLQTDFTICFISKVTDCSLEENLYFFFDMFNENPYENNGNEDKNCIWNAGEIGNFGNSTEEFWENLAKRDEPIHIGGLLKKLEILNPLLQSWEDLMTHNATNIERSVWPFIENKIQVCNTISNHLFTLSGT